MKVHPKFWQVAADTELALRKKFLESAYIDPKTGQQRGKFPNLICKN